MDDKKKPLLALILDDTKSERLRVKSPLNMFMLDVWVSSINIDFVVTEIEGIKKAKDKYDTGVLKENTLFMINVKYAGWHQVYTDGSISRDGIGAAYFDPRSNKKEGYKIVSKCNSIMSVELLAISEALSYILTLDHKKFVIFSDSRSALQHIARCVSGIRGASVAYAILKKIQFLREKGVDLRLQWVPSHIGLKGNDEADILAKDAIENGSEVYMIPEEIEILNKYRYKIFEKWKLHFDVISYEKGIWYKILQKEPLKIPWFGNSKLRRTSIVVAHRLRSGHMPLNKFKNLMKISDSPNCTSCGVPEDVHHVLVECVRSQSIRSNMLTQYGFNFLDVGAIQAVLSTPHSEAARALYKMVYELLNDSD